LGVDEGESGGAIRRALIHELVLQFISIARGP
jgi:hypothetical protein